MNPVVCELGAVNVPFPTLGGVSTAHEYVAGGMLGVTFACRVIGRWSFPQPTYIPSGSLIVTVQQPLEELGDDEDEEVEDELLTLDELLLDGGELLELDQDELDELLELGDELDELLELEDELDEERLDAELDDDALLRLDELLLEDGDWLLELGDAELLLDDEGALLGVEEAALEGGDDVTLLAADEGALLGGDEVALLGADETALEGALLVAEDPTLLGADEVALLGADETALEGALLVAEDATLLGADDVALLGADETALEGALLAAEDATLLGADEVALLGADETALEGALLAAEDATLLGADEVALLGADDAALEGALLGADDATLLGADDGALLTCEDSWTEEPYWPLLEDDGEEMDDGDDMFGLLYWCDFWMCKWVVRPLKRAVAVAIVTCRRIRHRPRCRCSGGCPWDGGWRLRRCWLRSTVWPPAAPARRARNSAGARPAYNDSMRGRREKPAVPVAARRAPTAPAATTTAPTKNHRNAPANRSSSRRPTAIGRGPGRSRARHSRRRERRSRRRRSPPRSPPARRRRCHSPRQAAARGTRTP